MASKWQKSTLVSIVLLWCSLVLVALVAAQDDPCEIYGDGYVCKNDTRRLNSVPFEDPLTCEQNLYENVMKLLDDGAKILEAEFALTDSDEAVMMIGNTGTGKSTLSYFLAGDNSKMFSYQMETDLFLIKDCNGKIGSGDSTIVSATIYPDLVIENSTGTPFYDNPGFQDTRSVCVEIANTYFMRQIANHIKKVKFVIVVNKFEVSSGGSREDFPRALRNVFNFIPNIEKFGSGLALVATKLAGLNSNDDSYVKDVVSFMNKSKSSFPEIYQTPDELQKANFLVDSIANVSRVGVFRMPSECGPLSEIDLMQKNRANIIKVILENIQYVESSPDDFALTISADAQVKVQAVGLELSGKIKNSVQTLSSAIYNFFMFHFTCIQQNNCDELVEDLRILFSNPDFINEYDAEGFVGLNFTEIAKRITKASFIPPKLVDSLGEGFLNDVVQSAGHLDFMSNLATLNVDTGSWLQLLKDTHRYLKEHIGGLISDIDQTFVKILRELSEDFESIFEVDLKALVEGKLGDSTQFEAAVVGLYKTSYDLSQNTEGLDPSRYVREIRENIQLFKNGFSDQDYLNSQLLILSELSLNLDFLTKSFNSSFNVNPKSWVAPLNSLKSSVREKIRLEIENSTSSIGYLFSELLRLFDDHFSQLSGNTAEILYQNLDIARRQFNFLNTFSKSVSQGELRKDFVSSLKSACDSVNSVFIILGSQNLFADIIRLDSALIVLERLNIGEVGKIPAEWVIKTQESSGAFLQHILNFAKTDVNSIVQSGASSTAAAVTSRLKPTYEVADYPLDKQRNFIADYQKIQQLVDDLKSCATLKCFSSKNFKVLAQLTQAAAIPESSLQKLPGQNLQVDLDDLGQNPYKISEWRKSYEDALAVLTTVKNRLKGDRPILESPRKTNWGTWGSWDQCPEGTFVNGMQLKDDRCESDDCVAVSAVRFFCSPLDSTTRDATIMSSELTNGAWRAEFTCPNGLKAVGFELNVDGPSGRNGRYGRHGSTWPWSSLSFPIFSWSKSGSKLNRTLEISSSSWFSWPQGADACGGGGGGGGNTRVYEAAVNMRVHCEDGQVLQGDTSLDEMYQGVWTGKQSCKTGQYLCGMRTQVEFGGGDDGDWTGLNNVDAKCCYVIS